MTLYHVWAEHTGGKSVGHPCTTGVFSDPTDHWSAEVTAESEEAAQEAGQKLLEKVVEESEPCRCQLHIQAGSDLWWNSVCITASRESYPDYVGDDAREGEGEGE